MSDGEKSWFIATIVIAVLIALVWEAHLNVLKFREHWQNGRQDHSPRSWQYHANTANCSVWHRWLRLNNSVITGDYSKGVKTNKGPCWVRLKTHPASTQKKWEQGETFPHDSGIYHICYPLSKQHPRTLETLPTVLRKMRETPFLKFEPTNAWKVCSCPCWHE